MAYDEQLADRIRKRLARRKHVTEMKMFGGVAFLVRGNVCAGVWQDSLLVRVGPDRYEDSLRESFVREFDITGQAMTGWVLVGPEAIADADTLHEWLEVGLKFVKTLPGKVKPD